MSTATAATASFDAVITQLESSVTEYTWEKGQSEHVSGPSDGRSVEDRRVQEAKAQLERAKTARAFGWTVQQWLTSEAARSTDAGNSARAASQTW